MKRYKSHKTVEAAPIVDIRPRMEGGKPPGHGPNCRCPGARTVGYLVDVGHADGASVETFSLGLEFFARGRANIGDYLVRYDDGYLSWSPKKPFEDGYAEEKA